MYPQLTSVAQGVRRFCLESLRHPRTPGLAAFDSLALQLFELQYALNSPYRAFCEARAAVPGSVRDWKGIPAVSTAAFKEFSFTCIPESARTGTFESSGTTQSNRSRNHHCTESLALYKASLLPWFQHHLLPETRCRADISSSPIDFVSLTPSRESAPHSSLVHMLDVVCLQPWFGNRTFAGRVSSDGWILDIGSVREAFDAALIQGRAVLLAGTAFNFVHLLEALGTVDCALPRGSRIMETGGYKGRSREMEKAELYSELSRGLGIPPEFIVTEYGMTELGSQAYDQVAGTPGTRRTLKFPPWARATVVSPETGEEVPMGDTGLVQVVDLANAYSVIGIETGDVAVRETDGIQLKGRKTVADPRGCSLLAV